MGRFDISDLAAPLMAILLTAATAAFMVAVAPGPSTPTLPPAAVLGLDVAEAACLMHGAGQKQGTIKTVVLGMIPELADKRGITFSPETHRLFQLGFRSGVLQMCPSSGLVDR